MLNLIEFVVRESDDGDLVYVCAVPALGDRVSLNLQERDFLASLLPETAAEVQPGLWKCEDERNVVNRLMVPGVCVGDSESKANSLMQWYEEGDYLDLEEEDDDDDDDDLWDGD